MARDQLNIRTREGEVDRWRQAAQPRDLTTWVREHLNRAAGGQRAPEPAEPVDAKPAQTIDLSAVPMEDLGRFAHLLVMEGLDARADRTEGLAAGSRDVHLQAEAEEARLWLHWWADVVPMDGPAMTAPATEPIEPRRFWSMVNGYVAPWRLKPMKGIVKLDPPPTAEQLAEEKRKADAKERTRRDLRREAAERRKANAKAKRAAKAKHRGQAIPTGVYPEEYRAACLTARRLRLPKPTTAEQVHALKGRA